VLMLVRLVRLGEAHRWESALHERDVIAAAQVSVAAIDQPDAEAGHVLLRALGDEARELPRRGVVLAADAAPRGGLLRRLVRRYTLGEDADALLLAGADDVVGEHGVDVHVLLLGLL